MVLPRNFKAYLVNGAINQKIRRHIPKEFTSFMNDAGKDFERI